MNRFYLIPEPMLVTSILDYPSSYLACLASCLATPTQCMFEELVHHGFKQKVKPRMLWPKRLHLWVGCRSEGQEADDEGHGGGVPTCVGVRRSCAGKSGRELGPGYWGKAIWWIGCMSPLPASRRGSRDVAMGGANENDN